MKSELHEKLFRFQFLLHKKHKRFMHGSFDPMYGQGRVLALLKMKDNVSSRELMYLLGMSPPSVSELLAKLEKAEFITREQSEQDRRVSLIKLTEKGKSYQQPQPSERQKLFDCLSEQEKECFNSILDKLIERLKETLEISDEQIAEKMSRHFHRFAHCRSKCKHGKDEEN
ncbi:MAG: MarR family transcriptional regulator [Firmicutes bacterium]|nr:MarR family transcriptional regulator [Bacillota bacterium]